MTVRFHIDRFSYNIVSAYRECVGGIFVEVVSLQVLASSIRTILNQEAVYASPC